MTEFYDSHIGTLKKPWTKERIFEVMFRIKTNNEPTKSGARRTPMHYYWTAKYDIMTEGDKEYLIIKKKKPDCPTIIVVPVEEYFDILFDIHTTNNHCGRDKMLKFVKNKYYIQKKAIEMFLILCPTCGKKRKQIKKPNSKSVVPSKNPIGGIFGLIDFQSSQDGNYKFLLNYQDFLTKFIQLRPLITIQANEIASELLKIFLAFGAPAVLQSDISCESANSILKEIYKLWPQCGIEGISHDEQSSDSIEPLNQEIKNMLSNWLRDNSSTNWSLGCYFVQYQKNTSFNTIIGKSPYGALFGNEKRSIELSTEQKSVVQQEDSIEITIEEDLSDVEIGKQQLDFM